MSARDPGAALLRAVRAHAAAAGLTLTDARIDTCDWASATFVGHRHRLHVALAGAPADAWLAGLTEAEWRLSGHVVVDVSLEERTGDGVILTALTLHLD